MFGRIGWICNQCNNFNYETRNKCNRCGVIKQPKKISEIKKKKEEKEEKERKKKEAKGDWICQKCNNLNFGFRKVCNRCQIPRNNNININNHNLFLIDNNNIKGNHFNNTFNQKFLYGNIPLNIINNGQININYSQMSNNKNINQV